MSYVITQSCCNDASCVAVCPVNCIHPTPDEPDFMTAEMLYIDPAVCIDCGACVDACPVEAIKFDIDLEERDAPYLEINESYYEHLPPYPQQLASNRSPRPGDCSGLRVAIVGSGPAAFYAAGEVLKLPGAEVHMYERLSFPYGLIRWGVAPDHPQTKIIANTFRNIANKAACHLHLNVEIGKNITHADLQEHHSAVIYATGAMRDRQLGIPGEDAPGSWAATDFVAFYNGHPEYSGLEFDLSSKRAVIVGNGNVAMDVARILTVDPELLSGTDMTDDAVQVLRSSAIEEVVIVARRGAAQAAFTNPEFLALLDTENVDVIVELDEDLAEIEANLPQEASLTALRTRINLLQESAARPATGATRRIIFRFLASPIEIVTEDNQVVGLKIMRNSLETDQEGRVLAVPNGEIETIQCGLVFRSIGYLGSEITDVPFDKSRALIPNQDGRVQDPVTQELVPGVYVTGWIKRGATGVIGTNKKCARDTVANLFDDFTEGSLPAFSAPENLSQLLRDRCPNMIDFAGWQRIDAAERAAGVARNKPRVKFTDVASVAAAARA